MLGHFIESGCLFSSGEGERAAQTRIHTVYTPTESQAQILEYCLTHKMNLKRTLCNKERAQWWKRATEPTSSFSNGVSNVPLGFHLETLFTQRKKQNKQTNANKIDPVEQVICLRSLDACFLYPVPQAEIPIVKRPFNMKGRSLCRASPPSAASPPHPQPSGGLELPMEERKSLSAGMLQVYT